jgi:membrane-bound lytic murein transglycosylase D
MKRKLAALLTIGLFATVAAGTYRRTRPVPEDSRDAFVMKKENDRPATVLCDDTLVSEDLEADREQTVEDRKAQKSDLSIPDHPAINTWITRLCENYRSGFQTELDRSRSYAGAAQEIFARNGLPKELIYIALIESGYSPDARSRAGAVGIWQFMPQTGSAFGLARNKWIDERRHPVKSAQAAADYLSVLYNKFGSWPLALAAYNAGETAVHGALGKGSPKTFWDLMEKGYLPAETRNFVPKVFAAVKIIRNPDRYGFRLDSEHFVSPYDIVSVPGGLKLSWIGRQIGVPEEVLRSCNPELRLSVTPPGRLEHDLSLPFGTGGRLLTALAENPQGEEKPAAYVNAAPKSQRLVAYRVKSGDTLSGIAGRHNYSVTALASLNGMKLSRPIRVGQVLKLPGKA